MVHIANNRSSHWRCSVRKGVLRNLSKKRLVFSCLYTMSLKKHKLCLPPDTKKLSVGNLDKKSFGSLILRPKSFKFSIKQKTKITIHFKIHFYTIVSIYHLSIKITSCLFNTFLTKGQKCFVVYLCHRYN